MKAFWFAFNPADWLSSKSVRMMSNAERGAYITLLATAWGEEMPGTLPAAPDTVRRLAGMSPEEWALSGPCLLAVFPLAECGTYRYNPRLLAEAGKRVELVEKKAEAGRKSAERRARLATQGQQSANTIPTGVEINPTGVAQKGNQLQSQLQLQSSKEDDSAREASSPAPGLSEGLKARLATLPDTSGEHSPEQGPLGKPARFKAICDELHLGPIDHEHYRAVALLAAKGKPVRTDRQWESWIANFFTNRKDGGPLLKAKSAALSAPTPAHELPPPGQEQRGQVIVIAGINSDASMNRMKLDSARKKWPTATIHAFIPGQRHD